MGFEFFHPSEGKELTLEEVIFQALGAASVCWDSPEKAGVFHSEEAKEIGEKVLAFIQGQLKTDGDFITIGPECFANRDGTVICYKGENYYISNNVAKSEVING